MLDILSGQKTILLGRWIRTALDKISQEYAFSVLVHHTQLLMEFVWFKREIVESTLRTACVWGVTLALFSGEENVGKETVTDSIRQLVSAGDALLTLRSL